MNLFVANWKLNMLRGEARAYAQELGRLLGDRQLEVEIVLAPSFTSLDAARDPRGRWSIAAQNVCAESEGACTGEVSARMLSEAGCRYVILGHSERRRYFGENEELLRRKIARARESAIVPIYCVGETGEEHRAGSREQVLERQLAALLGDPNESPLVLAYEPVWAIGSGQAATPADAATVRSLLAGRLSSRRDLRILYGGSVTAENSAAIAAGSGMDGFLVGGASLSAASFAAIAGAA